MEKKRHPYELRLWFREKLPWFLINIGVARKGEDCEKVKAEHEWYNQEENISACYFCKVEKEGSLWKKEK
ncbi:MAG: hypothetical protein ABI793_06665 [Flavobacterium sp.]